MALDPDDRYATVEALRLDMERYLGGRPLAAVRRTPAYVAGKWLRRNRPWVILGAGALLLGTTLAGTHLHGLHAEQARTAAEARHAADEARRADAERRAARRQLADSYVRTGAELIGDDPSTALLYFAGALALDEPDPARAHGHRLRVAAALGRAPVLEHVAVATTRPTETGGTMGAAGGEEDLCRGGVRLEPYVDREAGEHGLFEVRILDTGTGRPLAPPVRHEGTINRAALSPDGRSFVTASRDKTARVWAVSDGRPLTPPLRHEAQVEWATWSPDGRRVATGSWDNTLRVWDVAAAEAGGAAEADTGAGSPERKPGDAPAAGEVAMVRMWPDSPVIRCAFSPDGRWVASGCYDGRARVWDASSGRAVSPVLVHGGPVWDLQFSPDGRLLLTASRDRSARVWEVKSGRLAFPPLLHPGGVLRARFDDPRLAPGRGTTRPTGTPLPSTASATAPAGGVAAGPFDSPEATGPAVVTSATDGLTRRWLARPAHVPAVALPHPLRIYSVNLSPDGGRAVTITSDQVVHLWEMFPAPAERAAVPVPPAPPPAPPPPREETWWAGFGDGGRRLITARRRQGVCVWDLEGRKGGALRLVTTIDPLPRDPEAAGKKVTRNVWLSPDGRLLAVVDSQGVVRICDTRSGAAVGKPVGADRDLNVSFSGDGSRFATAGWGPDSPATRHAIVPADGRAALQGSGAARVWETRTGEPASALMLHGYRVARAVFSPDGGRIATCSWDGTARLWDRKGRPLPIGPLRHAAPVVDVAFSPDGRFIATASEDHTARLWDADTGRPVSPPLAHPVGLGPIQFSPDSKMLLTTPAGPFGDEASCWESATGLPVPFPFAFRTGGDDRAAGLSFATFGPAEGPAGPRLLTGWRDGVARVWDLPADPRPAAELVRLAELLSGRKIDPAAGLTPLEAGEWRRRWEDRAGR